MSKAGGLVDCVVYGVEVLSFVHYFILRIIILSKSLFFHWFTRKLTVLSKVLRSHCLSFHLYTILYHTYIKSPSSQKSLFFHHQNTEVSQENLSIIKSLSFKVGNSDGRAGMAAVAGEVDIEYLAKVRSVAWRKIG